MKYFDDVAKNEEALAFDKIAGERCGAGFVPDLRDARFCPHFYNNVWRNPLYAHMLYQDYLEFIDENLTGDSILEVGCGTGFMSLELGRAGYSVRGIDISKKSIEIAQQTKKVAIKSNSDLCNTLYMCASLEDFSQGTTFKFDNVVTVGSLHHIENIKEAIKQIANVLNPGGRLVIIEPSRNFEKKDVTIPAILRLVISTLGHWHKREIIPKSAEAFEAYLADILCEFDTGHEVEEPEQSPRDNYNSFPRIIKAISPHFRKLNIRRAVSFFSKIIGGIRMRREQEKPMARLLWMIDKYLVDTGKIKPMGIMWAGEKR